MLAIKKDYYKNIFIGGLSATAIVGLLYLKLFDELYVFIFSFFVLFIYYFSTIESLSEDSSHFIESKDINTQITMISYIMVLFIFCLISGGDMLLKLGQAYITFPLLLCFLLVSVFIIFFRR